MELSVATAATADLPVIRSSYGSSSSSSGISSASSSVSSSSSVASRSSRLTMMSSDSSLSSSSSTKSPIISSKDQHSQLLANHRNSRRDSSSSLSSFSSTASSSSTTSSGPDVSTSGNKNNSSSSTSTSPYMPQFTKNRSSARITSSSASKTTSGVSEQLINSLAYIDSNDLNINEGNNNNNNNSKLNRTNLSNTRNNNLSKSIHPSASSSSLSSSSSSSSIASSSSLSTPRSTLNTTNKPTLQTSREIMKSSGLSPKNWTSSVANSRLSTTPSSQVTSASSTTSSNSTNSTNGTQIVGSSIGVKNIRDKIMNCPSPKVALTPLKTSSNNSNILINGNNNHNNSRDVTKSPSSITEVIQVLTRPLKLNDLDFTDLKSDDDSDILSISSFGTDYSNGGGHSPYGHHALGHHGSIPPPPPLSGAPFGVPPPPPPPPPPPVVSSKFCGNGSLSSIASSTSSGSSLGSTVSSSSSSYGRMGLSQTMSWLAANDTTHVGTGDDELLNSPSPTPSEESMMTSPISTSSSSKVIPKNRKTLKLFWKEVNEEKSLLSRLNRKKTIWDEINAVPVDFQKLEILFENKTKDSTVHKKTQEGKKSELIVLDTKRSNAINIGMTKLPPPAVIKSAILKMDSTIINREGIEKILTTMMPSEEEMNTIYEAQIQHPELPLGSAENFLLILSSIPSLEARLKLWSFRLDYDLLEKEMGEQLMDLKTSISEIEKNETFKTILGTLLSIGNFLNGLKSKGFQLEYLTKVPKVKDTMYKHSLLYHLVSFVLEKNPTSSDLYSDLGSVTRGSRVDYDELVKGLLKLESDCKSSWDHLKMISKNDHSLTNMKYKMSEFLKDCSERINVLQIVQRRVFNRFKKMMLYLGFSSSVAQEMKPHVFLKIISEFALEYRTTREKVKEQLEKKAIQREKMSFRSRMIASSSLYNRDQLQSDAELRHVLSSSGYDSDSNSWGASLLSSGGKKGGGGRNRGMMMKGKSIGNLYHAVNNESLLHDDHHLISPSSQLLTSSPSSTGLSSSNRFNNSSHNNHQLLSSPKLKPAKSCFFRNDDLLDEDEMLETILKTANARPTQMRRKRNIRKDNSTSRSKSNMRSSNSALDSDDERIIK